MYSPGNFAVIVPLANESESFEALVAQLSATLSRIGNTGTVYFVVDNASKDSTYELCQLLSTRDQRFVTVWAPENRNVVDAYLRGYREAYHSGHDYIIEMDGGLSHDPAAIPMFLRSLMEGNECAFGSRFINGGSIRGSTLYRTFLSRFGTLLSNILLGTRMADMTSGYQGFHAHIVGQILERNLLSRGHFYQTELRYLLREKRYSEVPIHYRFPSPSVSRQSIVNALQTLVYYFVRRVFNRGERI